MSASDGVICRNTRDDISSRPRPSVRPDSRPARSSSSSLSLSPAPAVGVSGSAKRIVRADAAERPARSSRSPPRLTGNRCDAGAGVRPLRSRDISRVSSRARVKAGVQPDLAPPEAEVAEVAEEEECETWLGSGVTLLVLLPVVTRRGGSDGRGGGDTEPIRSNGKAARASLVDGARRSSELRRDD